MGKLSSVKGVFKTMISMAKEDWDATDKKFYRVVGGAAGFIVMGLFWFFFLRHIAPF